MVEYNYYVKNILKPNIKEFNDYYNGKLKCFKGKKYKNPYKNEYYSIVKQIEEQVNLDCIVFNFCINQRKRCIFDSIILDEKEKVAERINKFLILLFGYDIEIFYLNIEEKQNNIYNNVSRKFTNENFIYEVCKLANSNNKNLSIKDKIVYENVEKTKLILNNNFKLYCLYTTDNSNTKLHFVIDIIHCDYFGRIDNFVDIRKCIGIFEYIVNRYYLLL